MEFSVLTINEATKKLDTKDPEILKKVFVTATLTLNIIFYYIERIVHPLNENSVITYSSL